MRLTVEPFLVVAGIELMPLICWRAAGCVAAHALPLIAEGRGGGLPGDAGDDPDRIGRRGEVAWNEPFLLILAICSC